MILLVLNRSSWNRLGESVAGLGVGLYRPLSRGVVRLSSGDPGASPLVDFRMLAHPNDVARMVGGLRFALELMQDEAVRPLRHELFTAAYSETVRRLNRPGRASRLGARLLAGALDGPGPLRHGLIRYGVAGGEVDESHMARETWLSRTVARRTMGMYHPAGTCRMGGADDPDAVVDADCAVRGVAGLHVADASVMPTLVRGTLNLPVMMIAERVADALTRPRT
jgi:5-(hydroxymethyl)furfural/furfural oxidase